MKKIIAAFSALFLMSVLTSAQTNPASFRVFDSKGNPATVEQIIDAIGGVEVVFLGENHDDATAHSLQFDIFRAVVAKYQDRRLALSLEMFERDVQIVVDEYLAGLITENHFLSSSRPWGNYKTDYRPLVELAKERKLPVIAANAPRRYVNMVSRNGRSALNALTKDARELWLAPIPYALPSEAYANKFKALMGPSPEAKMGLNNILDSQALWDATMAHSIYGFLKKNRRPLVVNLNGSFHSENRLGTPEHLLGYRKKTSFLVVTMRYEDDFTNFDKAKHGGIGDFVVLTDAKVPRSKRN